MSMLDEALEQLAEECRGALSGASRMCGEYQTLVDRLQDQLEKERKAVDALVRGVGSAISTIRHVKSAIGEESARNLVLGLQDRIEAVRKSREP